MSDDVQVIVVGDSNDPTPIYVPGEFGNRVRFDATQTLTDPQKAQARTNIGAASAVDVGDTASTFVATFEAGLV